MNVHPEFGPFPCNFFDPGSSADDPPPRGVAEHIVPILERHGVTWSRFREVELQQSDAQKFRPWAYIFFRNEYPLGGYFSELRVHRKHMMIAAHVYYARKRGPQPEEDDPKVAILEPGSKPITEELASRCAVMRQAWGILQDASTQGTWICLLPEDPSAEWVSQKA